MMNTTDSRLNKDSGISRRSLAQAVGIAVAAGPASYRAVAQKQGEITASQVVERIKKKSAEQGVVWGPSSFDGFHLGDPDTVVTGVATCFQSSFSVLRRAAAAKRNFVISHESTFWDGFDPVEVMLQDPVCQAKIQFAERNKMVVWRIHDHLHRRRPEPIFTALATKLGWSSYYVPDSRPRQYTIPEMTIEEVARHIQNRLGTQNVVVVGDRNLRVRTIGDCVHVLSTVLPAMRSCDVALVGETAQYDTFEYVRDAVTLGLKKGLIMISHEGLEEWGMQEYVDWLRPIVPEVPIAWISSGDPFRVPVIRT
jgi:putative NIF3 family GTP cyclohydrolase 1 type 2